MRIRVIPTYPATLPVALAAGYTWFAIAPESRAQSFAMLAMTAVGAAEMVLAAVATLRRQSRTEVASHLLVGIGGLACGYAMLDDYRPVALAIGALIFVSGLIVRSRSW